MGNPFGEETLINLIARIILKILSDTCVADLVIRLLRHAAAQTNNKVDDALVEAVAKAWLAEIR
ncbi:conserved hypothetical protein [Gammaproteobacteria bacterium]